jgi:hypothetical protein
VSLILQNTYNTLPVGTLDIMSIFPVVESYFSYEGSLTTPPCVEGVLFNIMTSPIPISQSQISAFASVNGLYNCLETDPETNSQKLAADVDLSTCNLKGYTPSFRNPQAINGRIINLVE